MRFGRYVDEAVTVFKGDLDDINKVLYSKCKPYINEIKSRQPFFRGMKLPAKTYFGSKDTRSDRTSLYFGKESKYPDKFNIWLQKEGHLRRDKNVVICSGSVDVAKTFSNYTGGKVYYIFPVGKVDFTFLQAEDVNLKDSKTGWGGAETIRTYLFDYDPKNHKEWIQTGGESILSIERQSMKKKFKDYFITGHSLDHAQRMGYETWFKCKEYYFADIQQYHWNWREGELVSYGLGMGA